MQKDNLLHQNFLRHPLLIKKLVGRSTIKPRDLVLDIGAGRGAITQVLVEAECRVIAIEADNQLASALELNFKACDMVSVYGKDFLAFDLPKEPYKVFANIPFNRTAQIVAKLLEAPNYPLDIYLVVQLQAAYKYTAQKTSSLAAAINAPWFDFEITHRFKQDDFYPRPTVDCVMLHIQRKPHPLLQTSERLAYQDFVAAGFTGSRTTLKKNFKNIFGHVQFLRLATDVGFVSDAKPTDLNLDQWLSIFKYFITHVSADRQIKIRGAYDSHTNGQAL